MSNFTKGFLLGNFLASGSNNGGSDDGDGPFGCLTGIAALIGVLYAIFWLIRALFNFIDGVFISIADWIVAIYKSNIFSELLFYPATFDAFHNIANNKTGVKFGIVLITLILIIILLEVFNKTKGLPWKLLSIYLFLNVLICILRLLFYGHLLLMFLFFGTDDYQIENKLTYFGDSGLEPSDRQVNDITIKVITNLSVIY